MRVTSFEPIAAGEFGGAISYSPQLDASGQFGEWEVHPQKIPVNSNGSLSLVWNGEYIAVGKLIADDGSLVPYKLACCGVPSVARERAEMVCALRNENKPTRVVDSCGIESVSAHTADSVTQKLNSAALSAGV